MASDLNGLIFFLAAYLIGSIPFGLVFSRLYGVQDPREGGSGNIGFTNVLRLSGKKVGILTLVGDLGKGWVIGWLATVFFLQTIWGLLGVLAVVLGHMFPIFLKFHGGKGVATGLGGILGLHFGMGLILVLIWLTTVGIWRYSSGGAITAFGVFPLLVFLLGGRLDFFVFSVLISGMILYKHKGNVERLVNGTESKIGSSS
ncbi:glycerol-3-phosphate 1-O-acyltransferase PlsY [Candidatus Nitronereus thalassa]|uniref:Glycerol-3-phosphate acyltransferase n=1 Tax=Candidatus Nitronereus thalassa TaxID=3020898 RepID=A0ABU3K447_9BACT|nr:glycerol-3-phosphate 1-O-acyltransferase PlsY [Candidatus Nitronereus thalassa]MDT7041138.1 glycerol-3-phosphate 1-O-acyltransferase PlsY [Candidatus Nitronereus thalassa]